MSSLSDQGNSLPFNASFATSTSTSASQQTRQRAPVSSLRPPVSQARQFPPASAPPKPKAPFPPLPPAAGEKPPQQVLQEENFKSLTNLVLKRNFIAGQTISKEEGKQVFNLIYWFLKQHGYQYNADNIFHKHGAAQFEIFLNCLPKGAVSELFFEYARRYLRDRDLQYSQFINEVVNKTNETENTRHSKAYFLGFGRNNQIRKKMQRAFKWLESGDAEEDVVIEQQQQQPPQPFVGQTATPFNGGLGQQHNESSFQQKQQQIFPGQAAASSSKTSLGGKENHANSHGLPSGSSSFVSTPVRSSQSVSSRNSFSVSKTVTKRQIQQMFTTPRKGTGALASHADGRELTYDDFSSVTDLNSYHETKMDSDQIIAKSSLSELLEDWKNDFGYVTQTLNDLTGTRRTQTIRLLKRVQSREDYNDFRKSVEAQVTLRENVIREASVQIARLQGGLDEGARRKVGDNLIGDRRERKDEEVRSIEEDYRNEVALAEANLRNEVALAEAKKNRRLAEVEAKYNAEEIEQEFNEKSCVRKWKSNLEDLRDDLGEHQQEMIASLTEVKAHLHLFQSTFELTEFFKDNSQWNSATQLHDLEWNPQLMQQYEQDLEILFHFHSLLQNKQWDELAQIVWES